MWYRMKRSLLALSFSTLAVLTIVGFGETPPAAGSTTTLATFAGSPPAAMVAVANSTAANACIPANSEQQLALTLASRLAALAVDTALREMVDKGVIESAPEQAAAPRPLSGRMPFYSFAGRAARRTET